MARWQIKKPDRIEAAHAIADYLQQYGIAATASLIATLEYSLRDSFSQWGGPSGLYSSRKGREVHLDSDRYGRDFVTIRNSDRFQRPRLSLYINNYCDPATDRDFNEFVNSRTGGLVGIGEADAKAYQHFTDDSEIGQQLNLLFPDARAHQIVTMSSRRFRRRFSPLSLSSSGKTVYSWSSYWETVV